MSLACSHRLAVTVLAASMLLLASCGQEDDLPGSEIQIGDRARIEGWRDAYRRGVDYRAVGSDPNWSLEITLGEAVVFQSERSDRRIVAPPPESVPSGHRSIFFTETDQHELIVSVSRSTCRDSVRQAVFNTSVTVTLDDERYHGCGRNL